MKIIFLSKSKTYTCRLLRHMIAEYEVVGLVCKSRDMLFGTDMYKICVDNAVPIFGTDEMYSLLERGEFPKADIAISNTYGRLIRKELISHVNGMCINFHGAILPDYKGLFAYNHGLLNEEQEWGVTAHFVNEKFDEGEIIEISKFRIDPKSISVKELEEQTQKKALELTVELLRRFELGESFTSHPQEGRGRYYSLADFEEAKRINQTDSYELIDRKIHAFYCPPYEGAYIELAGKHYELKPRT